MNIEQLWTALSPIEENKDLIRQDLERGLAPNLPYFIVGLDDVKTSLTSLINQVDSHFSYSLIWGQYGNGKTNIMKYLKYFFQQYPQYNTSVAFWRADVDRYDLITFLLYIIQNEYADDLMSSLKKVADENQLATLCENFGGSYAAIKDYVERIIEKKDTPEDLEMLVSLGTGKVYNANSFSHYHLTKLTDYNRREVLVFFLNVLAYCHYYIVFCIDELEKIQEKSRARFSSFLTSFRELIDLSSSIKGHVLLAAVTDSVSGNHTFESYNPAFERRIKNYMLEVKAIQKNDEIKQMATELVRVSGITVEGVNYDEVAKAVSKDIRRLSHTNEVVRAVFAQLLQNANGSNWMDILEKNHYTDEFEQHKTELLESGAVTRINQKFFAPLKDYVNIISNSDTDYEVKAQMLQCVYSTLSNKCYVFLFTSDIDANINRIHNVINQYPKSELLVFKPDELDITMDNLVKEELTCVKDIIPYNPIELMALLELYLENYENDNLRAAVTLYTHQL